MQPSSILKTAIFSLTLLSGQSFGKSARFIVKGNVKKNEVTSVGGQFVRKLKYHNAFVANMGPRAISKLKRKFPNIEIEVDARVSLVARLDKPRGGKGGSEEPTPVPPQVIPWGISRIGAIAAHEINRGAGIKVCVVDTGVDIDHPDLTANIVGGENFVVKKGRVDSSAYDDDNDHGTHVAGTIAAVDNSEGVIGVAPDATIFGVKVLDRRGSGYTSAVADGVLSCIANDAHIISMSLGSSQSSSILHDAIKSAVAQGLIVVAAAGNDYRSAVSYPSLP